MAKVISKNKDSFFNYEIMDVIEAGIELHGWEVKSIRAGRVNLKGAFCTFIKNELYISNMTINQYMNNPGDETRPRKLLLHKTQLKKFKDGSAVKGFAIVPTTLKWSSKGFVKVDIALGRGKSKVDKREVIKKRDMERINKKYY